MLRPDWSDPTYRARPEGGSTNKDKPNNGVLPISSGKRKLIDDAATITTTTTPQTATIEQIDLTMDDESVAKRPRIDGVGYGMVMASVSDQDQSNADNEPMDEDDDGPSPLRIVDERIVQDGSIEYFVVWSDNGVSWVGIFFVF